MAAKTVDGKTRKEWIAHYMDVWGFDEEYARFAVAVGFGDIPGGIIKIDDVSGSTQNDFGKELPSDINEHPTP